MTNIFDEPISDNESTISLEPVAKDNVNHVIPEEELNLFEKLHYKRSLSFDYTFSDLSFEDFWKGVIEKYPETAHFIYELIQNADDAQATEAAILLYKDKLVFKHNGKKQFSITDGNETGQPLGDINSITGLRSSKKDEPQTIGKFGVGFKSVFQYTDAPVIYDDTFWFRIDNYIIPTLLKSDHDLRASGETLFEIPFKNPEKAHREIFHRLSNMDMPVIFLPHIKKIIWKVEGEENMHEFSKEVLYTKKRNGITYDLCRLNDNGERKYLYVFKRNCSVDEGDYEICVGYFINPDGSLNVDIRPKIHCFFPTSETFDSCFISHAPFLLIDNRDRLKPDEEANQKFIIALSELAADALVCLRDIGLNRNQQLLEFDEADAIVNKPSQLLLNDNLFSIANIRSQEERNMQLKRCFLERIKEKNLILGRNRNYISVGNALVVTEALQSLFSAEQLAMIMHDPAKDFVYIKKYRNDVRSLIAELQLSDFTNETIAEQLSAEFMSKQTDDWIDRFIDYISENARTLWVTSERQKVRNISTMYYYKSDSWEALRLRFAPIVKTAEGNWVSPYTKYKEGANVVLPFPKIEKESDSTFGEIIDDKLYKKHKDFYHQLGLKSPNETDYIEKVILPYYNNSDLEEKTMKHDFKVIYNNIIRNNPNKEFIKLLKDKWIVRSKKNGDACKSKIEDMYIDNSTLRLFLNPNTTNFLDSDFYANEEDGICKDDVEKFFIKYFGVKSNPQVKIKETYQMPEDIKTFLNKNKIKLSKTHYPLYYDFYLEGYDARNKSKEWSHLLWDIVCKLELIESDRNNIENCKYNGDIRKSTLKYCEYNKSHYKDDFFDSEMVRSLKNDSWIYTHDDIYCKPSAITLQEFYDLGYEPNEEWSEVLDFCQDIEMSISHKEEREAKEREEAEQVDLINKAKEKGIDINAVLRDLIDRYDQSDQNVLSDTSRDAIPDIISNNIEELTKLANVVGEKNISYFTAYASEIENFIGNHELLPSNVRKIIKCIGGCIYEQYMRKHGIKYEVDDSKNHDNYDYKIEEEDKYIIVITTLKSIVDGNIPIGLEASQNAFMRKHRDSQFRIIRISIKDMTLEKEYNRIIGEFGKEVDPTVDERFMKECKSLAKNYWYGATVEEFDRVSPEYAIKIERKN